MFILLSKVNKIDQENHLKTCRCFVHDQYHMRSQGRPYLSQMPTLKRLPCLRQSKLSQPKRAPDPNEKNVVWATIALLC